MCYTFNSDLLLYSKFHTLLRGEWQAAILWLAQI